MISHDRKSKTGSTTQVIDPVHDFGGPCRIRTYDQRIKSPHHRASIGAGLRRVRGKFRATYNRALARVAAGCFPLALAACGGGGDAGPAPAAVTQPAQVCARPVLIQMVGDSTQWAQGNNVQLALDLLLGPGAVVVENLGASGTTAADFPAAKVRAGAVTVVNYGINDSRAPGATVEAYKARLRAIAPTVYETPSPPFDGYAQAMREVAAELGRPVIDVSATVRAMPGWEVRVWDGVHPDPGLYGIIARDIVAPALAAEVRKRLCAQ